MSQATEASQVPPASDSASQGAPVETPASLTQGVPESVASQPAAVDEAPASQAAPPTDEAQGTQGSQPDADTPASQSQAPSQAASQEPLVGPVGGPETA